MIGKFLSGVGRYAQALSPIELFNVEQLTKLKGYHQDMLQAMSGATPVKSTAAFLRGFAGEAGEMIGGNYATTRAMAGQPNRATLGNYFSGYNVGQTMGIAPGSAEFGALKFRRTARLATAGVIGGYTGGNLLFGDDNILSKSIGFGARTAAHSTIAAALYKYAHPMAGAAYAGLGLINMFRQGNNFGAF